MTKLLVKNRKDSWTSQQSEGSASFIFPGRKISGLSTHSIASERRRPSAFGGIDNDFDPLIRQQVEWNVRQVYYFMKNIIGLRKQTNIETG